MSLTSDDSRRRPSVSYISGVEVEVGTIFCVGRNYALHAKEMGSAPPSEPFFFFKPVTSILRSGGTVMIPSISNDLHHEVELVCLIDREMVEVTPEEGRRGIGGVAVGLDMTLRDVQSVAKKEGKPWSVAKGFDTSAPSGRFLPVDVSTEIGELEFYLDVNGERRQQGRGADMIFSPGEVISWLSRLFTLRPGDLIFTGTPEGVAGVEEGDRLDAAILGIAGTSLSVTVGRRDR